MATAILGALLCQSCAFLDVYTVGQNGYGSNCHRHHPVSIAFRSEFLVLFVLFASPFCTSSSFCISFIFLVASLNLLVKTRLTPRLSLPIRLYQAPPDSGAQPKPVSEKEAARARSSIRRSHGSRAAEQLRERRRRILGRSTSYGTPTESRAGNGNDPAAGPGPDAIAQSGASLGQPNADGSEPGRAALRDVAHRIRLLDGRLIARVGERWAHLHAFNLSPEEAGSGPPIPPGLIPDDDSSTPPPPTEPYATSNVRSTQGLSSSEVSSIFIFLFRDFLRAKRGEE